jgi:tetratricopeptide (TPR) repeat protein
MAPTLKRSDTRRDDGWVTVRLTDVKATVPDDTPAVSPDRRFEEAVAAARAAAAQHAFGAAAAILEAFLEQEPEHLGALEQLIEICLAGDLEENLVAAQVRLADVCLIEGRYAEAQVIAQDLALRYPDHPEHRAHADRIAKFAAQSGAGTVELQSAIDSRPAAPAAPPAAPSRPRVRSEEEIALDAAFTELRERFCADIVPAALRVARACREAGEPGEALAWLEWIAELPPADAAASHEIAYELGLALEAHGMRAEALGVYRELIAEVGPSYRDVASRMKRLAGR